MYWFNLSPKMVVFCELGRQGTEAQGYLQLRSAFEEFTI